MRLVNGLTRISKLDAAPPLKLLAFPSFGCINYSASECVSHGGHGATENFLAVDRSHDARFKPFFSNIKKIAEASLAS